MARPEDRGKGGGDGRNPESFPDTRIKVTEVDACPLYRTGDEFSTSGTALTPPSDKAVCLILVNDITTRLAREECADNEVFQCSGCAGRIKLAAVREMAFCLPPPKKSEKEMAAIAGLLSRFELFENLGERSLREIVTYLRFRKYAPGEIVVRRGDPGRNLYILASGRVEVLGDGDIKIANLESGEVFGEMSLLSGESVGATVRVLETSRVLYINSRDFRQILNRFPSIQLYFARLLARRLAMTNTARAEEFASSMIGRLSEMPPSELFQILNNNGKTGALVLDLSGGTAQLWFREGQLVKARYGDSEDLEAFFSVLPYREGRFRFKPGLPPEALTAEPLGDFMWLLMEGVNRIDEGK
ncbi:MAG: cyclic nucleotide-binding domain-containing protein [Desulfococcaceae bacterium]